ncbi:MAG TPA: STAS domain-containing protein, partial [Burkholderiaceae bacterium]|nr:STAS domain-containing protein [Burkholderiaceae bacterium]
LFKKSRKSGEETLLDAESTTQGGRDSVGAADRANSQLRADALAQARKQQAAMTAKIDRIEEEMRGEFPTITRNSVQPRRATPVPQGVNVPQSARQEPDHASAPQGVASSPPTLPPLDLSTSGLLGNTHDMGAIDVVEASPGLSPEVEEAAVLYANGQSGECIKAVKDAIAADSGHLEAWLLLFELHQQSGNFREFEALAVDYSVRFESSPPPWRDTQPAKPAPVVKTPEAPVVSLPRLLDAQVSKEIEQFRRHAKLDRVRIAFDAVREADAQGAHLVREWLRDLSKSRQQVVLSGLEVAVACLRNVLNAGERTHPESVWLLAMELLRMLRREKDYDDLSVDYTITFEVSPPQYEAPPAQVSVGAEVDKAASDKSAATSSAQALSGVITGKALDAITKLDAWAATSEQLDIDCSQLSRVDFAAAGSLLNWLMAAQARGRQCTFRNVNPLVAALFGMMGVGNVAEIIRRKN